MTYFGMAYFRVKEYENAVDSYKMALEMRKRLFPGDHEDVAESFRALGIAYTGLGDDRQVKELFAKAVEMKKILGR
jgi:tetratricopeptide (TPR) repeat protein